MRSGNCVDGEASADQLSWSRVCESIFQVESRSPGVSRSISGSSHRNSVSNPFTIRLNIRRPSGSRSREMLLKVKPTEERAANVNRFSRSSVDTPQRDTKATLYYPIC
jgi:hypothetical protein